MRKFFKFFGGVATVASLLLYAPSGLSQSPIAQQEESKKTQGPNQTDDIPNPEGEPKGLGSREVQRPDGRTEKIYYSITTPEEEKRARQEEKEKEEKSWDMLRNIIIDPRSKTRGR